MPKAGQGFAAASRCCPHSQSPITPPAISSFTTVCRNALRAPISSSKRCPKISTSKIQVFREIEAHVAEDCILASDTSGIPITRIQAGTRSPSRVIGMHWSNPPHIIPMIEVIPGEKTAARRGRVEWWRRSGAPAICPSSFAKMSRGSSRIACFTPYARMPRSRGARRHRTAGPSITCSPWGIGYKLAVVGPMALLDMAGLDIYRRGRQLSQQRIVEPVRCRCLHRRAHVAAQARYQDRQRNLRVHP